MRRQLPEIVQVRVPFTEVLTSDAKGRLDAEGSVDRFQKNDLEDSPAALAVALGANELGVNEIGSKVTRVTKATTTNARRVFIGHLP